MTTLNVFRKNRSRVRSGQMFLVDYWLILAVAGLLIIGMLMVYSTTFDLGLQWHDKATYFFEKQLFALSASQVL